MRFTLPALVLLLFASLATAQKQCFTRRRFKLRVATGRMVIPSLSGYLDIDRSGFAGFNRTIQKKPNYNGFVSYIDYPTGLELAQGDLYQESSKKIGYLQNTDNRNLFDFKFGAKLPTANVMSGDFAQRPFSCGNSCGGLGLTYGPEFMASKGFYAEKDPAVKNGYKVNFYRADYCGPSPIPIGGTPVFLIFEFQD